MSNSKISLVKTVATEGGKLQRKIVNALVDNDPQSPITAAAIAQHFADINTLVQGANIRQRGTV
jgi:hypothetical protein